MENRKQTSLKAQVSFVALVFVGVIWFGATRAREARGYAITKIPADIAQEVTGNAHRIEGGPRAGHDLVVYSSYTCAYCRTWWHQLDSLMNAGVGMRIYVKHLVPPDSDAIAYQAALAVECAGDQGAFKAYHVLLFNGWDMTSEGLLTTAVNAEVPDTAQFNRCLTSELHRDVILRDGRETATLGVSGTPSTVLGRRAVTGLIPPTLLLRWMTGE